MARLILEENGKKRAFNLRDGKLSIGSGDSCTLTLESADIAEVHAELELRGDVATLIPRPGVMPPMVNGRPISAATELGGSASFQIGSANFSLQGEGQPVAAAPAAAPRAHVAAKPAATRKPAAAVRKPAAAPRASGGGEGGPRVQHRRRTVQKGIPSWMVVAIIGVIALVGYFVGKMWLEDRAPEYDPRSRYLAALDANEKGALAKALEELDHVDLQLADPELKRKVGELRKVVEERSADAEVAAWNVQGTKWMETQLKGYEQKYLKGNDVTRAKARLFIKRCDEFRETYPKHPQLGWVERFRSRWLDTAQLNQPDDLDDVTWEVKMLTSGKPRDYVTVFKLLNGLSSRADGAERDAVQAMIDTQNAEREEYFTDRMQQARWHWERKEYGQAVEWLIQVVTKIGDTGMRDQATDALLKMTNQEGVPLTNIFLGGYKQSRPWQFEQLCEDPRIKAAAREAGLL
jgi:hypothetical protein